GTPFSNVLRNKFKELFILTQTILQSHNFDCIRGKRGYNMKKEFFKKRDFKKKILISSAVAASLLSVGNASQLVKAASTSSSQTDQQSQVYSWTFKGLGDTKFATIEINGSNLNVVATGVAPHVYWKNRNYAFVKVIRDNKVIYEKDFIGNKGVKFNENFTLKTV
ncbi:putative mucin/carbohydrate-binding domain-containing protein, partial [Lactobacillus mulieris]|uniref:putative mucin/carbohydrate-binding domain-containing protein n=1 Tax=Lactobacillus mulieris TaxID=2508708 RepID=UPI00254F42F0